MRGYFGIGIVAGKCPENLGGLWRSAHAFGASYLFTVGARYPRRQRTDVSDATSHVPLLEYDGFVEFMAGGCPPGVDIVGVEIDHRAKDLRSFVHPERAVYVLGAEDRGLDSFVMDRCHKIVSIPSSFCLNVATAGSIVLYDRIAKTAPIL